MPRVDDGLARIPLDELPEGAEQRLPVAARKVGATHRPREEDVAGEQAGFDPVGEVRGRVAGDGNHVELDPGEVERLAPLEEHVGRPAADRNSRRRELPRLLEQQPLARRPVHGGARAVGKIGETEDMVEVAVRDEDRCAPRAEGGEVEADLGGGPTRVDDDGVGSGSIRADDVAVRPQGAEWELVDDGRHARECTDAPTSRCGLRRDRFAAVQSWDLTELEAPGGTVDPTVLMTDDGARAIAIRLAAGQELSDHQVRERAWLVVVEGEAEVRSGGDVVRGGVGTLATFRPGERHAVSSETGARILLLLAPWPGDGHYLEGETAS